MRTLRRLHHLPSFALQQSSREVVAGLGWCGQLASPYVWGKLAATPCLA